MEAYNYPVSEFCALLVLSAYFTFCQSDVFLSIVNFDWPGIFIPLSNPMQIATSLSY